MNSESLKTPTLIRRCPICGNVDLHSDLTIHYWRENPLPFSHCPNCEATFANPMPTTETITKGNDALVRFYQRGRTFTDEFRDARQAYLRGRLFAAKLKRFRQSGRLLDIGCFNGFLPLGIHDHSQWQVEGVEISEEMSRFVNEELKIKCHRGTLEELALPENSYDFIICHDLIEHINQPEKFLAEIARILKPGGRIQIITPNSKQDLAFSRRAFQRGLPVTMLLNHIFYFSPKTLKTALDRIGLKTRRLYCYDLRYVAKDFGWFGAATPTHLEPGPSMHETLKLEFSSPIREWNAERIEEVRRHPKVRPLYGFFRETLPRALRLKGPAWLGWGHEIYAIAEKPLRE